jgi:hypothetical protein
MLIAAGIPVPAKPVEIVEAVRAFCGLPQPKLSWRSAPFAPRKPSTFWADLTSQAEPHPYILSKIEALKAAG